MTECIVTSSLLIVAVIVLRSLFGKKISRRLGYALWGLVLIRLLLPFPLLASPLSVMNAVKIGESPIINYVMKDASYYSTPAQTEPGTEVSLADPAVAQGQYKQQTAAAETVHREPVVTGRLFTVIWLFGTIVVGAWFAGTNLLFFRRLVKTRITYDTKNFPLPVYVSDRIASPCLFGFIQPAVYLTPKAAASKDHVRHVLAHELCHYRHGDHIWSVLRGVCLAAYWWNPLVWVASVLSRADSELACDEAVIRQIGEENRLSYGHTLVDMIAVKRTPSGLFNTATTMVSDKRGVQERLNLIIKNPRTFIPALAAVIVVIAVIIGLIFTGARATPLTAREALDQLLSSITYSDNKVTFQIPKGYEPPQDWNIYIAGRQVFKDGFSQSVHLFEDVNEAKAWQPGKRYTIDLTDAYTELMLTAFLPGEDGKKVEKSVDLLRPYAQKLYDARNPYIGDASADMALLNAMGVADRLGAFTIELETQKEPYILRIIFSDPVADTTVLNNEMIKNAMLLLALIDNASEIQWRCPVANPAGSYLGNLTVDDANATHNGDIKRFGQSVSRVQALLDWLNRESPMVTDDGADLDACVSEAILDFNKDPYHSGDFAAEAHTVLKMEVSGNTTTVYAMVLYQDFNYTNGWFTEDSGSHMPVAITFAKNAAGEYVLKEYWIPKDGSYYAPSIEEKFPSSISWDFLDTQKYILAHEQSCYAQAIKYGKVDVDARLAKLIETICSSPAEASNPSAYIDAHPIEYRELKYCGDYTLQYVYAQFLKGGQTGLPGQIMLAVMRELLGKENIGNDIGPAQEWFDAWKDHAVSLLDANSMEFMEKNYPKTAMLLRMLN